MAEFSEVIKHWKRMCQYYTERAGNDYDACAICKFEGNGSNCLAVYEDAEVDTAEVERVVMAWAAEHPEPVYPTWIDTLKLYKVTDETGYNYLESAYKPIPADIAEKLGIQPKEDKSCE